MKLIIAVAGGLAVLMMIIGGTQYVAAGVTLDAKSGAKDRIQNAAIGLALTLASYLILVSINPKLVQFNLNLPPIQLETKDAISGISENTVKTRPTTTLADPATGCRSCTEMSTIVPHKTPQENGCSSPNNYCYVSSALNYKLVQLAENLKTKNISWQVTESWPPTRTHIAACQNQGPAAGTCVDASLTSNKTPESINLFADTAKQHGLRVEYEVSSDTRRQQLISGGVPRDMVIKVAGIDGEHFSVYNN
jgi:hypothetical protein